MRGARLFGAAEALRDALVARLSTADRVAHELSVVIVRSGLGDAAFRDHWEQGRRLSREDAVGEALASPDSAARITDQDRRPTGTRLDPLTPREREVAALIACGLTSREVAEALVISEKTADTHADHIRTKLGLRSRAEIAAWATARGLRADPRTQC